MIVHPGPAAPAWQRLIQLAERDPRRAGLIGRAWRARSDRSPYDDLAIGWALLRWERFAEAEPALIAAESRLPRDDAGARLRCARARLMLEQMQGAGPDLQERWEAHGAACAAAGHEDALLQARCEQIAHLNLLGQYARAHALAEALSSPIARAADPATQARSFHVAAVAAIGRADLTAAEGLLDLALQRFQQLARRADLARSLFERGWLNLRREHLAAAEADLQRARAIYQRFDLPFRVALCERDLGTVAYLRGEYGPAIAWGVAARTRFLALGRQYHAAGCDFNLGTVAHVSGLYDLAFATYQRAEQIYLAHNDHFHAVVAGRNQVLAACAQGDPALALALADALAPRSDALGDPFSIYALLAARAQALGGLGRVNEAAEAARQAAAGFRRLGNQSAAAECDLDLAWRALAAGDLHGARRLLAAIEADVADRPTLHWRVAYGLGLIAARRGDHAAAAARYAAAIATVAGLRRRLASEHASSGVFQQARDLHHAAIALAARRADHAALLTIAGQQQRFLDEHRMEAPALPPALAATRAQAREALRAALATPGDTARRDAALEQYLTALLHTRHAHPPAEAPAAPLDLAAIQECLSAAYGNNWSLLCPLFSADQLFLLGVTPAASFCTARAYDADLRALLRRACASEYRQLTYRDLGRLRAPELPPWQTLQALGACLLPEWLSDRLDPDHRLLIVPSGPLHSLAWAALRVGDAWLCERAILTVLPSLPAPRPRPPLDPTAPGLLLGCTTFGTRAAPLPEVPEVLALAARHWPGPTERWMDAQACVAQVQAADRRGDLARYGLIHIATHAQLGSVDGLLAHLKLSDDDLLLDDVRQLRLGADLVVLTACEGGAGAVLPGDEVIGLSRALLAAGGRRVLAGLWTLYDQGVLALMGPLYSALAAGHDPPAALAMAQRTLLALPPRGDSMLHTPYVWAGFTVLQR